MQAFALAATDLIKRADVGYAAGTKIVERVYAGSRYPLVPLSDLATLVQYGSSTRADARSDEAGALPMLRMANLRGDTLELEPLKYVRLPTREIERYLLKPGDLLFNRTNSKELVGKCAVFSEPEQYVFASYLVRVRLDETRVRPEFVAAFLATPAGRVQIDRVSRQIIGMANVNGEEIRDLLIPLPPLEVQDELLAPILSAKARVLELRESATDLTKGGGAFLESQLQIEAVASELPLCYALPVRRLASDLRMDAKSYRSQLWRKRDVRSVALGDLAEINPRSAQSRSQLKAAQQEVPFVGLPDCDETRIRSVTYKPPSAIGSAPRAEKGDILFARIEPSIYNKKYVFVDGDHVPPAVYTSSEFYVLRANRNLVLPEYLWATLFTDHVFKQISGQTTGSSGRRRLPAPSLASVQIPLPDLERQEALGAEMMRRRSKAERLAHEVDEIWARAKMNLQSALLGDVAA